MRKLTFFSIAILISFSGCKEPKPTVRTHMDLFTPYDEYHYGQLKSVKEENFWAVEKDGKIEKGRFVTEQDRKDSTDWTYDFEAFYNEEGIVTRVNYFNDARGIDGFWATTIENNKVAKAIWTEKDTARFFYIISYDEQGNYKESKRYNAMNDTLLNTYVFKIDENGNIIETVVHSSLGVLTYKYTFRRNEEGLTTEQNNLAEGDSLTFMRRYTYDDKGFIIADELYDGEKKLTDSYKIEYTEYNNNESWLKAIYYRKDKPLILTERTYTYY